MNRMLKMSLPKMTKPVILFESYPDFSGSPLEIYKELIKRGYDEKYDLIWAVYSDFNEKTDYKVVKFHGCNTPEKADVLRRCKCIIDSNRYIQKPRIDCFRLHVRHGFPFKNCKSYLDEIGYVDAIITSSEQIRELDKKIYQQSFRNNFIITGYPALDALFRKADLSQLIKELTGKDRFSKIIGWLPTFRKHRFGGPQFGKKLPFGIPTIYSVSDYKSLNDELVKGDALMIIQMHHAQANDYGKLPNASNIVFVTEDIKRKYNITTHNMMSSFDAMITDYSAAYHEFLILDRPIALTIDDIEEYKNAQGFCCDYFEWIKGEYIRNSTELFNFIDEIANGDDEAKLDREFSLHRIHQFIDNKSTERVVNYLEDLKVIGR